MHGLIVTVEKRILPHLPSFIEFIVCALQMENCDAMGTRLACGLISDLANAVEANLAQWMPQIVNSLLRILEDDAFDSEAKLIAIIAFGDICLAAGPRDFLQYLPQTQKSFARACQLSLSAGDCPEEVDLLERLRIALIEASISLLHGLQAESDAAKLKDAKEV